MIGEHMEAASNDPSCPFHRCRSTPLSAACRSELARASLTDPGPFSSFQQPLLELQRTNSWYRTVLSDVFPEASDSKYGLSSCEVRHLRVVDPRLDAELVRCDCRARLHSLGPLTWLLKRRECPLH